MPAKTTVRKKTQPSRTAGISAPATTKDDNSCSTHSSDGDMADMSEMALKNNPDQHAFVMLGSQTLFLAHLTMFHMEDHMYQLVVQASLPDYAMELYRSERKRYPNEVYFLGNNPEDLFYVPQIATGARSWFLADVFRGIVSKPAYESWPWADVTPVIPQVRVNIERVVLYRHFDFNLNYPRDLTYLLFGAGSEAHLHHYQVKEPDFDHTLSLAAAPDWLPEPDLEAGVPVNFPELPNACHGTNPLTKPEYVVEYGGRAKVLHKDAKAKSGMSTGRMRVKIGPSWWCSTKVVNMVDPCHGTGTP